MKPQWNITTERLFLTPYAPAHLDDVLAMNSDAEVMRYIGPPQTHDQTEAYIAKQVDRWQRHGFGWWAVFEQDTGVFVGGACLQHLGLLESNPLEIGWRLITAHTGKGYATEAGQAALRYGFDVAGRDALYAVAMPENTASHRVMQRLGMKDIGIQRHYDTDCTTYEITRSDVST